MIVKLNVYFAFPDGSRTTEDPIPAEVPGETSGCKETEKSQR
jgi:hypothetical protein